MVGAGSRGDVQPYIALGRGLKAAGHDVRFMATDDFEGPVTDAGLTFLSTGGSLEAMLQSDEWRGKVEGGNFLVLLRQMTAETKRRAHEASGYLPGYLAGAELMVAGLPGLGSPFTVAESIGIPILPAYLYPITPTNEFPGALTPPLPLPSVFNGLSIRVMRQMIWQSVRSADVVTRQTLGLPKGSFFGPFKSLAEQGPTLYGYSEQVIPRPADWDASLHITGYWFLDQTADWQPDAALVDFLAAGAPPVYIGFGSMGNRKPEEVTAVALEALALSGQRGVLASGWGGMSQADLPADVHMISAAPHDWLFPQMAAVVHHGGVGTTAAGLRAGAPSVIVPFFGDQPFWGRRVVELGAGPEPLPRKALTAERLAQRIRQAVTDETMRRRAADVGRAIRAEDGVGAAVGVIDSWLGQQA
jgi:sterol 3beta-glucosyltransferase